VKLLYTKIVTNTQVGYHLKPPLQKKELLCRAVDLNRDYWRGTTEIEHSMKENSNQVSMKWWFHYDQM
jgi:hypothetical protein